MYKYIYLYNYNLSMCLCQYTVWLGKIIRHHRDTAYRFLLFQLVYKVHMEENDEE